MHFKLKTMSITRCKKKTEIKKLTVAKKKYTGRFGHCCCLSQQR